jgi:hypothetical protein
MTVEELIKLLQKQDQNKQIVHMSEVLPSAKETFALRNDAMMNNLTRFSEKMEIIDGTDFPVYYGKYANSLILVGEE